MKIQEILQSLKDLTYSDLYLLHTNLIKHVYAKGLEDYIQASQFKDFLNPTTNEVQE